MPTYFALRARQDEDLYFEDAVSSRWCLGYYRLHASLVDDSITDYQGATVSRQVVMTQSQKYKKAFVEAQKLARLVSEVSTARFTEHLEVLHPLTELWRKASRQLLYVSLSTIVLNSRDR